MSLVLFETGTCTLSKIHKTGGPTEFRGAGQSSVSFHIPLFDAYFISFMVISVSVIPVSQKFLI
jgi:hypothetical protein